MSIESAIGKFEPISLAEMDGVKLMNRTDRKYWFNTSHLTEILVDISDQYYLLEVDGERNMPYATTYYDTPADAMYNNHHRGKMNRYKIRRRNYLSTNSSFLEVKFKSNKGRTVKVRRKSCYNSSEFDPQDCAFIATNSPYTCDQLEKVLENQFKRLMLVSKAMNERCTIDSELHFMGTAAEAHVDSLVIVEVKTDGRSHSAIIDALNKRRLKPSGFSKYCVGRSIVDSTLKINRFKKKHRAIEKTIDKPINNLINQLIEL